MLVCVDVFSKHCAAAPMDDQRPETVVAALRRCFAELGIPVRIYTDEGGEFENRTMDEFLASVQVTLVTTRSHANFVERMIRTLKEKLRVRQLTFDEPWDQLLPAMVKQYKRRGTRARAWRPSWQHWARTTTPSGPSC